MEPIIIAVIVFVAVRIIAGLDIPLLSPILRGWWNISFKLAAFIPFCGWMTWFIITRGDEKAMAEKEFYRNVGRETDQAASEMLERSAERARAEEETRQRQLEIEEENRRNLEDDMRRRAYNSLGRTDVYLNRDGSAVRVGDSDYVSVEEFKRQTY